MEIPPAFGRIFPNRPAGARVGTPEACVIIMLQGGNATVSWNASVTGAALVEHSPELSGWAVISQNNTTGIFRHATGNATRGFYRVRWTPETFLLNTSLASGTAICST